MTYKVVLKTIGKRYVQQATSIEKALANMKLKWSDIKGKGTVTVYSGTKRHEHQFNKGQLQLLVGTKLRRAMWSSRLLYLMKEGPDSNIPKKLEIEPNDIKGI